MARSKIRWASVVAASCLAAPALGGFSVVTGAANAGEWFGSAGAYTSISFSEFSEGTFINEQYSSLGIHFADPVGNLIFGPDPTLLPQDGWGLKGLLSIDMRFDTPMRGLAVYYPAVVKAQFYLGDQLVYSWLHYEHGGSNKFAGFMSDVSFDRVVFKNALNPPPWGDPYPLTLDNLYFTPVPAPGAAACLLGLAPIAGRRRRGRSTSKR